MHAGWRDSLAGHALFTRAQRCQSGARKAAARQRLHARTCTHQQADRQAHHAGQQGRAPVAALTHIQFLHV